MSTLFTILQKKKKNTVSLTRQTRNEVSKSDSRSLLLFPFAQSCRPTHFLHTRHFLVSPCTFSSLRPLLPASGATAASAANPESGRAVRPATAGSVLSRARPRAPPQTGTGVLAGTKTTSERREMKTENGALDSGGVAPTAPAPPALRAGTRRPSAGRPPPSGRSQTRAARSTPQRGRPRSPAAGREPPV